MRTRKTVLVASLLIGAVVLLYGLTYLGFVRQSPMPRTCMDFDCNARVSWREAFRAIDLGERAPGASPGPCEGYYWFKDGQPVETSCSGRD